jgi:hypothetical protein
MDDASTARADAAVTMSRPKAADERVGANWAVGFAHEVEVTRRGREARPREMVAWGWLGADAGGHSRGDFGR